MKRVLWSTIIVCLGVLGTGIGTAFAEKCDGTEGMINGEWQIHWIKTGNTCSCSGDAETWTVTQTKQGTMTANLTVYRGYKGKGFMAMKRNVTDGNDCNYIGAVIGDMTQGKYSIKGQYFCKNGGPYNWEVTCVK
ncbi:hypothetical protein [Candidatus Electronema sp. JC]|uniref:hypothetical protein n=1 Tax=Candidatus Electronema sp. JC TaxID=3401570 RepID=UPI003B43369C